MSVDQHTVETDTITIRNPADGRRVGAVPVDDPDTVAARAREVRLFQPEWEAVRRVGLKPRGGAR